MRHNKRSKKRKISRGLLGVIIVFILLATIVIFFVIKERLEVYNTKKALDQTLIDVTRFYNDFTTATAEPEDLAFEPINTCDYKNGKALGYTCQTKALVRYTGEKEELDGYFKIIDRILNPQVFTVDGYGQDITYDGEVMRVYELRHVQSGTNCKIYGIQRDHKVRFTFECLKDSDTHLYQNEDDRVEERFNSNCSLRNLSEYCTE